MTTTEAKQKAIREAYISAGVDWEQVKEFLDENGAFPISRHIQFVPKGRGQEWSFNEKGIYPKSLSGIETNNGWISIESEKDLPSEVDKYWVIGYGLDYPIIQFFDVENKNEWLEVVTHYQPIVKPKPPLY